MADHFFNVSRTFHETSQGKVQLPILYYDTSLVGAFFRCDLKGASKLLEGTGLEPVSIGGGKGLAGVAFFEYRNTTVGSYNECGITLAAVPVTGRTPPRFAGLDFLRKAAGRRVGLYITDLPVTTPLARAAGRELWGFPKFVTEIPFELAGSRFACKVMEPEGGREIFSLAGRVLPSPRLLVMDLLLYSNHQGAHLKTVVEVRSRARTHPGWGTRLSVTSSSHRMAKNLRDLGLDGASPFLIQTTPKFQSRLPAGEAIEKHPTPPLAYA
ncbi:MAG: acetoacetate decarboxylase family protein [Bdellovibrionota bacterium]